MPKSQRSSLLVAALLTLVACSNRSIPALDDGGDGFSSRTDRLRVHGTFCPTMDPQELRLPIKILFVVDTSQSMAVSDPTSTTTGKTGRRTAIEDVIAKLAPGDEVSYAIISFSHVKQVLTRTAPGLGGFTRDPKVLESALSKLDAAAGLADYEGAWTSVYKLLGTDISRMRKEDPRALQRSTYIVLFLADGAPSPQIQSEADWSALPGAIQKELTGPVSPPRYNVPETILERVKEVVQLASLLKVALRVHTFLLQNGPASNDAGSLLQSIAGLGHGSFRPFASGEQIDFLPLSYASQVAGSLALRSLVVGNQSLLAGGGALDSDGDGLGDAEEQQLGTGPLVPDTDGDGWSDAVETLFGYAPLDPMDAACPRSLYDSDGDGLLDCEEFLIGTSSKLPDTDADGFDDRLEVLNGTNPLEPDSADDQDNDGVSNGDELRGHTSPDSDEGAAREDLTYRYAIKQVFGAAQVCYSFDVSNIRLAGPPAAPNTIVLLADQVLAKNPGDYGSFRAACVRVSPGPAPLEVAVPQSAWKRLGTLDPAGDCVTP